MMKTQQMMETSHWYCVYVDYHDKPHSKIFDDKQDAMAEMKKIKRRIQKSSAEDTVSVMEKDTVYGMATKYGTQIVLVMKVGLQFKEE